MTLWSSSVLVIIIYILNTSVATAITFKLELLQVLFRHGDRTPEEAEIYKADPYADVFRKIGVGHLTNIGKEREYKIGQVLRERYNDFLGDYEVNEVNAYSTDKDRTKMSLDLVLAGLYPPSRNTKWNDNIFWLPIPSNYNSTENDFFRSFVSCQSFNNLLLDTSNSAEYLTYFQRHADVIDIIKRNTNFNLPDHLLIAHTNNNLKSVLSLGLTLPDWCTEDTHDRIDKMASAVDGLLTATPALAKITVGPVIQKFLNNINVQEIGQDRTKIHLYSTHDLNVAALTKFHNFTNAPVSTEFGNTIVVEKLRGSDNRIYLRMFAWTGVSEKWIPLKFQNCSQVCPLSDYIDLINWVLPINESTVCFSPVRRCTN